ncbi:hypothetical protein SARC_00681 [Sphaeroforma arctica JP610]|uniref:Uncharacterized protein n=1 Tax=Sphaeroforma arctica JP610 TaxID=667725 RepID=A0A0L0GE82_9EUKA|nr:hypothetical protein SARC_00681 [Sphaeroforma arctica JP610]KNC87204.1 hypothetical protein SARC_00681 [Sphaeroforma arctica JP610]|eukprot:XP_014161106.1 hypothetical protein SARC_00681 [Sphaeroforma arctica JP610]
MNQEKKCKKADEKRMNMTSRLKDLQKNVGETALNTETEMKLKELVGKIEAIFTQTATYT